MKETYTASDIKKMQQRLWHLVFKKFKKKVLTDKEQHTYNNNSKLIRATSFALFKRWRMIDTCYPVNYLREFSIQVEGNEYAIKADGETYIFNENDYEFMLWKNNPQKYANQ